MSTEEEKEWGVATASGEQQEKVREGMNRICYALKDAGFNDEQVLNTVTRTAASFAALIYRQSPTFTKEEFLRGMGVMFDEESKFNEAAIRELGLEDKPS